MRYFKGRGGHLEHVAFLVLWLSRYVFPSNGYNTIAPNLFSIAISLANGTRLLYFIYLLDGSRGMLQSSIMIGGGQHCACVIMNH
uniref:Aminotransferase-like plant mobile domain-containing protein n=1 Tax=Chenopodium quinoa TaxID=63459 RepID=A0A803LYD1_CHEQI